MSPRRTLLAVVLAFLTLGACATAVAPTHLSSTQADLLIQWQGLADRVLDHYQTPRVRLIVKPRPDTEGAMATSGALAIPDQRASFIAFRDKRRAA